MRISSKTMNIKFILVIIITQKSLIHCKISSHLNFASSSDDTAQVKVIRAIDNAILMTMTQDISLITDSSSRRSFMKLLFERLNEKVSLTLTNINLSHFRAQLKGTGASSSLMILVLEDHESFDELFLPKFTASRMNFRTDAKFLLIFIDDAALNTSKVFNEFWKLYIYNVVVMKLNHASFEILTFYPFSQNGCNSIKPIAINKFSYENLSWIHQTSDKVFPQKFKNFHQCPIKVSTFEYPPNVEIERFENKSFAFKGYEVELLDGLSDILNFHLMLDVMTEPNAWGTIFENGTALGLMRKTINGEADIGIGVLYLTYIRAKFMSFTVYTNVDVSLVIPRGSLMTPLEKLFSPFDANAWIAFAVMFAMGLVIISLLLRLNPRKFHEYIFGKSSSSHLNMIDIFLNGAQHFMPAKDSARFLLIGFVFYSLIVRTLYQAAVFKFLQTDQRHAELQTIDELLEMNFKIYMFESFQELSKGLKIHKNRAIAKSSSDFDKYQMQTLNPNFKGATVAPNTEIIYANQQNYKKFTFNVLPEIIFSVPVAMFHPKNHYIAEVIAEKVRILESVGISQYWNLKYYDKSYLKRNVINAGPKKLTIDTLSGIFITWTCGCGISILCFILELLYRRICRKDRVGVHRFLM